MSPDRDTPGAASTDAHLDPGALASLAAHLGRCAACRGRFAGAVQIVELSDRARAAEEPADAFVAALNLTGSGATAPTSEWPAPPEIEAVGAEVAEAAPPEPAATTAAAPVPDAIADVLRAIEALRADFETKIRYDGGREAIINRLHEELQEHKADLYLKILRPLALELIGLHDDLGKRVAVRDGAEAQATAEAGAVAAALESIRDDLEDMLYRCGFEAFVTDTPQFDPKRQRVVRTVPATDPALDRVIAQRLRKGFAYEGRVIRPELVNVHVATPPAPPAPTTTKGGM